MNPKQIGGVTAQAYSPDRMVRATAGAFGDLCELHLDPRHQHDRDADALAATILATVHAAAELAARKAFAGVAGKFPPGTVPERADLLFGPVLYDVDQCIRSGP
jgi:YbaB/EbfC DNA-binding family